jgi:ubiquinone/menaquinone biosynthesis C-methylase UbiE
MAELLSTADAERLRSFERDGHNALASKYCEFFAPVTAQAITPLLDAVGLLPGMRLLDVASGPGNVAAAATARGAHAIGIDLSASMVELARRLHPGIEFREADAEQLPFADASFDALAGCFIIGHLPYPEKTLAEFLRTLKPGSRMAFTWWDDPSRHRIQALFREATAEVGIGPPAGMPAAHSTLRFCARENFLQLLRGAGLADISIENHTAHHTVESVDALWTGGVQSMVLTTANIRSQGAEVQNRIREAFQRRTRAYQTADGVKIPVSFNVGSGRKPL